MRTSQDGSSVWKIVRNSFAVLSAEDKRKLFIVVILQILIGFLDLVGVIVIGLISIISVNGIRSIPTGTRVTDAINLLGLTDFRFQTQVALLGLFAAFLLISRTMLTMFFTRKMVFYLSRKAALISSEMIAKLLSQNLLTIQKRSSQETLFAVTTGVNTLFVNVIGAFLAMLTDLFLLLILSIGLISLDIYMSFFTFVLFASVSLILYFSVQKRISGLGNRNVTLIIRSNEKILEALNSYRDIFVRNRRAFYSKEISDTRLDLANVSADLAYIPNISKYIIEITLVIGAMSLCAIQFALKDASQALTTLSVFLAASSRIAPAILRIQSSLLAIKSNVWSVGKTLNLMKEFSTSTKLLDDVIPLDIKHKDFCAKVELRNVNFKYSESPSLTVSDINIQINPGEVVAFVGPSGAGKSTVIDIALGIIKPDHGDVIISGLVPLEAINKWPGAIAYVPQDVQIIDGSIKDNVALGFSKIEQIDSLINDALEIAQLNNLLSEKKSDLNLQVGERGVKLSGGQRQRLGIARALYLKPKLIVFDEATSSLDGQTEEDISEAIFNLRGEVTVILIAHRLSTVKNADKIVYMENGKILAVGKFEEVRRLVPNFDTQASLMGI
jgi:ABC-type multidrug transport system fused ATPase/permease subunit